MTHCRLLPLLADNGNFHQQQELRVSNMYKAMKQSDNCIVSHVAARACTNATGTLGKNAIYLRLKYGVPQHGNFHFAHKDSTPDEIGCAQQIAELLGVRDGSCRLEGIDPQELTTMIHFLCTN